MSKEFEEEVFSPSCSAHFACDGSVSWVRSQDVEGEASDDGEVFGSVVLAGPGIVFVEDHVEGPMELVFYGPMGAHDGGKLARREGFGQSDI